jgi:tetratricopeptide (TPR) repeat protein
LRADPGNFSLRRELAYTHMDMGSFLEWSGDEASALDAYARAVPLLEALVEADPRNADARLLLAEAYNSVGYGQVVTGRVAIASENLSKSLRLFENAAREDPANARAQVGLARLYDSFGSAAEARRRSGEETGLREARGWYAKSRGAYLALGERGLLDPQTTAELEAVSKKLAALPPA